MSLNYNKEKKRWEGWCSLCGIEWVERSNNHASPSCFKCKVARARRHYHANRGEVLNAKNRARNAKRKSEKEDANSRD